MEYVEYAKLCLNVVRMIPDQESRIAMREMAGEWMKLAAQSANDDVALGAQATSQTKRRTKVKLRAVN